MVLRRWVLPLAAAAGVLLLAGSESRLGAWRTEPQARSRPQHASRVSQAPPVGRVGGPARREAPTSGARQAAVARPGQRAWRLVDLASGRTLDEGRADVLARAIPPGSIVKIATLIAALEAGVISPSTRVACPGAIEVNGRRLACLHPRAGPPLAPDEALAHSCNVFFAQVGRRVPRERLDRVLAEMGLPPAPADSSQPLAAAGIDAAAVPPEALLRALVLVVSDPPGVNMRAPTRAVVMRGLRGGARFGTAAALGARGIDALAKTGTSASADGERYGLLVAAWPAGRPARAAVVVVAGGTGPEAAALAVQLARDGRLPQIVAAQAPAPAPPPPATRPRTAGPVQTPSASVAAVSIPSVHAPSVRLGYARGGSFVARDLPLEDYVAHVVAGEAAPRSARSALEALAIATRTFALANRGRHARDGFDLCDLTHCQVLREPYDAARAAASATAGLVLSWQDAPAQVFYTASCGGRSERPSNVWPGAADPPYLPSRDDHGGCRGEPRWAAEIPAADLLRALAAAGHRGTLLREMRVTARSESGRATELRLTGLVPDRISGQDLRMAVGRALGWHLVKSTRFELSRRAGAFRFQGRGYGHGVGLCVIGAARRAADGWSRDRLLRTYFPGLTVTQVRGVRRPAPAGSPIAPPAAPLVSGEPRNSAAPESGPAVMVPPSSTPVDTRVRLLLPARDESERVALTSLISQVLAAVTARAGRPGPAEIQVVFQPTATAFQRATGQPEWTAGSTRGIRVDLQPLAELRRRGTLEDAIAHELGHVVTAPVTRGRPAWVIEGAAMYAAGAIEPLAVDVAPAGGTRIACPDDVDVRRPASPSAADRARAGARMCFARALASGRRWYEVR